MKIYLDANRPSSYNYPGQDWTEMTSYVEFRNKIDQLVQNRMGWISVVSFDNEINEVSGADCLKYLVNKCVEHGAPLPKIYVHSENTGSYIQFENICDIYRNKTDRQYVLESRRKFN